jgi:hypothetical protein
MGRQFLSSVSSVSSVSSFHSSGSADLQRISSFINPSLHWRAQGQITSGGIDQ